MPRVNPVVGPHDHEALAERSYGKLIAISKPEPMSQLIARRLLDHIFEHGPMPGTRLPSERELARQLGVGRSAVREALKSLGFLGLIEVRQGDGTYIRPTGSELLPRLLEWGLFLGERRVRDLLEVRLLMEREAAALAAERRDDDDIAALQVAIRRMECTLSEPEEFVAADVDFHLAIAAATHNTTLKDLMASMRALLDAWITRVVNTSGDLKLSYREHIPVVRAVVAGDPRKARSGMTQHMESARKRLMTSLASTFGDDGNGTVQKSR